VTDPAARRAVDETNERGLAALRSGEHREARRLFAEAVTLARASLAPADPSLLESLYNRATWPLAGARAEDRAKDLEEVLAGVTGAKDERGASLEAAASHNLAVLREEAGNEEEARALYSQALSLLEARHGASSPRLRPTIVRLGQLEHRAGRTLFALALYERALLLARTELGPDHPQVRALEAWRNELTG
jgi:tetratricopeptide (TPR) repeat protein